VLQRAPARVAYEAALPLPRFPAQKIEGETNRKADADDESLTEREILVRESPMQREGECDAYQCANRGWRTQKGFPHS
jgi:hypothetical protein